MSELVTFYGCRGAELAEATLEAADRMAKGILEIRMYDSLSVWDEAEIARADFLVRRKALTAFRASGEAGPDA